MAEVNWELIIFIIVVGLIIFAGMGIFIGTRISSDKRRIRELEDELAETKKELELYRSKVNNHFKKTSELFTQMTSSYRAIYMHLAEGSQELCTTDAALLKPANGEFLKVTHTEEKKPVEGASTLGVEKPAVSDEEVGPEETAASGIQPQKADETPEEPGQDVVNGEIEEGTATEPAGSVTAEERKEL